MFRSSLLIFLFCTSVASPAPVDANDDYQSCVFTYVAVSEEASAASLLRHACERLYLDNAILTQRELDYFDCLLSHLPKSRLRQVSMEIKANCTDRHLNWFPRRQSSRAY